MALNGESGNWSPKYSERAQTSQISKPYSLKAKLITFVQHRHFYGFKLGLSPSTKKNHCICFCGNPLKMKVASDNCSVKKSQYFNIMWLTGKHLCWSLFLILSIGKFYRALIFKNFCKQLLLKMFVYKNYS